MVISKKEILDLFEDAYQITTQIAAMSREITEKLSDYADSNKLSKKALRSAFGAYKSFKEGKVSSKDEDYFTILAIVEEHFSDEEDNTADTVSA